MCVFFRELKCDEFPENMDHVLDTYLFGEDVTDMFLLQVSNDQFTVVHCCIEGIVLPSYMGILINHDIRIRINRWNVSQGFC